MRQSKFHRDIPNHADIKTEITWDHISVNSKNELIGTWAETDHVFELEHLAIEEKLKLVGELIERKTRELEGYTELAAGLIIQHALPDALIVRKK